MSLSDWVSKQNLQLFQNYKLQAKWTLLKNLRDIVKGLLTIIYFARGKYLFLYKFCRCFQILLQMFCCWNNSVNKEIWLFWLLVREKQPVSLEFHSFIQCNQKKFNVSLLKSVIPNLVESFVIFRTFPNFPLVSFTKITHNLRPIRA